MTEQPRRESLYHGLRALWGRDLETAERELAWVEAHVNESPDLPLVAGYLREIVDELKNV